ncbi:hypothetical protein FACS1894137_05090 [Spirochaetia bacterium]|nr:hypothetical protein FACS1894137_05090 [Spirochaetia bacterium]
MKIKCHISAFLFLTVLYTTSVSAQEALVSDTERYYDLLALQGLAERPYLNYRTLSDSDWTIEEGAAHPWQAQNLGTKRKLVNNLYLKIFGPELFNSVNSAAPYGQNDGALWQGKGYNASLSGGARLEAFGFELTLKPQLSFSQNAAFNYIKNIPYAGDTKAGKYGYYGVPSIDAPQRFGDDPLFTYDWGDSEIRYSWKTLTIGFGTQPIWLGPARINPIIHSNNAASYPKFDIGLRKQSVTIPKLNWYLGDIELRLWAGYLSESDYFDNNSSNDHNLITALAIAYAPSFLPGFTLSANRSFLTKWAASNLKYIGELFLISLDNEQQVQVNEDQRASITADWLFPAAGVEVYGELGINDYTFGNTGIIRNPFHTMAYNIGLRKTLNIVPSKKIYGELLFEWTHLEMSQDFQFQWPSTFYAHHIITQGYTNRGQWIGAGIGTGGNSQYLGFKTYYPKGYSTLFIYRNNPDNDYWYASTIRNVDPNDGDNFANSKAILSFGIDSSYFITTNISLNGGLTYNLILNPFYHYDERLHNVHLELGTSLHF